MKCCTRQGFRQTPVIASSFVNHQKRLLVENKEMAERFSNNLQSDMEKLFEKTLKLSKLWPAFQKYLLSDEL